LQWKTNKKSSVAYQIAPTVVTLSVVEGQFTSKLAINFDKKTLALTRKWYKIDACVP